jgi:hypothetical protein
MGLLFYEGTAFGDWITQNDTISFIFFIVNFVVSHLLVIILKIDAFSLLSGILFFLLFGLFMFALSLYLPYLILYVWLDVSAPFFKVIYVLMAMYFLFVFVGPLVNFALEGLKKGTNVFFDGLTTNAINRALDEAKKNK